MLIKGTIIPDAKSPSTSELYWLIHSYVHGYRWITEFRDRWNLPWTADQPALAQVDPEKRTLRMDGHEETVYFNLLQPLVGAALLSFFGVVLDCLESELSWINRKSNRKMNCLLINSIQLSNMYMYHLAPSLGKWRFLPGAFWGEYQGKCQFFAVTCATVLDNWGQKSNIIYSNNTTSYIGWDFVTETVI